MVKKPVTNNVVEGGGTERERQRERERGGEGRPTLFQSKFSTSQLSWQI